MEASGLGANRLRKGFNASSPVTNSESAKSAQQSHDPPGSHHEVISISDDDPPDSEGGIVINVDDHRRAEAANSLSEGEVEDTDISEPSITHDEGENEDEDEDEDSVPNSNPAVVSDNGSVADDQENFIIDSKPSLLVTKLTDLDGAELESQLMYGYWFLDRDQIDLNRPVRCIYCHDEGHLYQQCSDKQCSGCNAYHIQDSRLCPLKRRCATCRQTGHPTRQCNEPPSSRAVHVCTLCNASDHVEDDCLLRFFPPVQLPTGKNVKLWISCCICASKDHLVGDCPETTTSQAARWSLKSADQRRITNLSLQTGTRKLEQEAENRGSRPPGLQIKGRANLHQTGSARLSASRLGDSDDEDDYEPFLRAPVSRNRRNGQDDRYHPPSHRYDRFEAPNFDGDRPPRDSWYATDSFGRIRSRSPAVRDRDSDYRDQRRSPSPIRSDRWRPGGFDSRRHSPEPDSGQQSRRPPLASGSRAPTVPRPNVHINLPTRRGSNNHVPKNGDGGSWNAQTRQAPNTMGRHHVDGTGEFSLNKSSKRGGKKRRGK